MLLFLKNLVFTILVPGTVAVYIPVFVFCHATAKPSLLAVVAASLVVGGASMYFWCLWDFAMTGRGTPFPLARTSRPPNQSSSRRRSLCSAPVATELRRC